MKFLANAGGLKARSAASIGKSDQRRDDLCAGGLRNCVVS